MISSSIRRLFSTLVLAEHKGGKLSPITSKLLSAAVQLGKETHVLFLGHKMESAIKECQTSFCPKCFQKILVGDHPLLENNLADISEHIVKHVIEKYNFSHIISSAGTIGKDLIPRLAAAYDVQPITDISSIIDENTFQRPIYAGNAICTVKSKDKIKLMTIRSTSFEPRNIQNKQEITDIEPINVNQILDSADNKAVFSEFVKSEISETDRPELTSAKIVVSGGRGLKNKENFSILEDLAKSIGNAAIGASRAAVDAGFVSNDLQVGQTGKVVAPDLYIAVGISGAIQHLAGMKDSKVIVAINKDPEAPIFQVANYGIVGDLFKIVPELTEKLKK